MVGLESLLLLFDTGCKIRYAAALSLILTYQMTKKKKNVYKEDNFNIVDSEKGDNFEYTISLSPIF